MLSDAARRERAEAARQQQEELEADRRNYRLAKAHFADLERRTRRFTPLSPTQQRWRGLRDE